MYSNKIAYGEISMDKKEKQLFENLYSKFENRTFGESDVYQLMIMLRDRVQDNTLIKEIGDLVAHRQRDRGIMLETLREIENNTKNNYLAPLQKNAVFGFESFKKELNSELASYNLNKLSDEVINEVLLFIASLLQFSTYKLSSKSDNDNSEEIVFVHFFIAPSVGSKMLIGLTPRGKNQAAYALIDIKDCGYFLHEIEHYRIKMGNLLKELRSNPVTIRRNAEKTIEIYHKGERL